MRTSKYDLPTCACKRAANQPYSCNGRGQRGSCIVCRCSARFYFFREDFCCRLDVSTAGSWRALRRVRALVSVFQSSVPLVLGDKWGHTDIVSFLRAFPRHHISSTGSTCRRAFLSRTLCLAGTRGHLSSRFPFQDALPCGHSGGT